MLGSGRADALLDELSEVIRAANAERNLIDPAKFDADLARNRASSMIASSI